MKGLTKFSLLIPAVVALGVTPAVADKRLDEAVARADQQVQRGRTDEAVKTLQRAVSQMPSSSEAHAALARLYWQLGNADEGRQAAVKAAQLSASEPPPVRAQVLATVSGLTLLGGSARDALEHAKTAVEAQETVESLSALARAQARTMDKAAVATAEKAVEMGASNAVAQEALGEALLAAGRATDAEDALRKAVAADPKLTAARVNLAQALLAQGKAAEAVAEARKATELDARSGEAFAVLGLALLAENKDNWSDAIAQAQQGAFLNPGNPVVQVAVGRIFEAANNLDQAANAYKRALEADPGHVPARAALIQAQMRRGEVDAAAVEAEKLATEAPNSGDAQLLVGRVRLRKGDFPGAVEPLERAAAALPQNAEAHALLGTAYQYTRQSADALEAYKKAVALAPQNADYRATYGLLLGIDKQYEAGVNELKKVVATPGYKEAAGYVNLGWLYRNMDPSRPEDSITAYQKALQLDPKNEQAALGLGWSYSYLRKYDDAIAAFNKAIQLDPKTAGEAHNGIAWSYFFKKDMARAKQSMEQAKAAGRNDTRLANNIDKFEKGLAAAQEEAEREFREAQRKADEPDIGSVGNTLMRGNPAARRSAARQLRQFGRPAVDFLVYAAVQDKDFSVREEAINSLGALGGAAAGTCSTLKQIAASNPYDQTIMEKAQMAQMAAYEDVRRAARAAVQKIGCN